ncbi:class A beta-lactamase [Chenggangzhangella methanolivorans]|uniref:Beta-lactamase n=1 Tax=Chenggangzhangella methanolivorans TaxID=1437009 RepID=A0A9E6RCM3_9HYPH|nr:class A beta-lactamase [Chenggangzhangella methanolivorans]QZN98595.1 class A beta-lactamase [Chenggangzhangella methanolivorans]
MRRRTVLTLGLAAALAGRLPARAETPDDAARDRFAATLDALEAKSGGRLGVALVEVGGPRRWSSRGSERFPITSTFKTLLAASVLARVDAGTESLDRRLPVTAADLVEHSPFAQSRVGGEASVRDLCEATMTLSDNASANLLLPSVGGPKGLTRFARSIGDPESRLDRIEPALNEAAPGDPRDTTTPEAMALSVERLVFGEVLTPSSRGALTRWLVDGRTGAARLRAGLPQGWAAGDKTGGGANGTANDVAVIWPPAGAPLVLACYLTGSTLDGDGRDAIHADVARAAVAAVG